MEGGRELERQVSQLLLPETPPTGMGVGGQLMSSAYLASLEDQVGPWGHPAQPLMTSSCATSFHSPVCSKELILHLLTKL
jgi:hypothetical protein